MKRIAIFALMCVVVCSCQNDQRVKMGLGGDPAWISSEEARQRANELMVDRYPGGEIVEELGKGRLFRYRFATNDIVVPLSIVVDRKNGKARFEKIGR